MSAINPDWPIQTKDKTSNLFNFPPFYIYTSNTIWRIADYLRLEKTQATSMSFWRVDPTLVVLIRFLW